MSEKTFWGVNYYLVGKELAEDLKFLPQSPWSLNIVREAVFHGCFFQTNQSRKPKCKKKIRDGEQNLKDHWPLAWRKWNAFVKFIKRLPET